jgi:phosphonate transport system substrate-binding protein
MMAPLPSRPRRLIIGLLPGESRQTVLRLNEPLRAYLQRKLCLPVDLVVGPNYAATGEALRFGRIDIAYLGPVSYIFQSRYAKLEVFARPTHVGVGPTFQAVIIVPKDSRAKTLTDLRGKEVAFGDPASTSGTWVPRYQLAESGLLAERDYKLRVLGDHATVAQTVAGYNVAAGGLSLPIYQRLIAEGKLDADAVRVLALSPAIPEYMWTFRENLDLAFHDEIRKAFLSLTDPDALRVFNAEAFIPAVDSDVDRVRGWIDAVLGDKPATMPAPLSKIIHSLSGYSIH